MYAYRYVPIWDVFFLNASTDIQFLDIEYISPHLNLRFQLYPPPKKKPRFTSPFLFKEIICINLICFFFYFFLVKISFTSQSWRNYLVTDILYNYGVMVNNFLLRVIYQCSKLGLDKCSIVIPPCQIILILVNICWLLFTVNIL